MVISRTGHGAEITEAGNQILMATPKTITDNPNSETGFRACWVRIAIPKHMGSDIGVPKTVGHSANKDLSRDPIVSNTQVYYTWNPDPKHVACGFLQPKQSCLFSTIALGYLRQTAGFVVLFTAGVSKLHPESLTNQKNSNTETHVKSSTGHCQKD